MEGDKMVVAIVVKVLVGREEEEKNKRNKYCSGSQGETVSP